MVVAATAEKDLSRFPDKARELLNSHRYKVMYGGRGGAKTWSFCRALLALGAQRKLYILCAREIQKSITETVHRTLSEQIDEMGYQNFYRVLSHKIVGINGTEFVFAGLRNNITAIKSMEGIDICAVFEATFVSEHSWTVLLPTVRRDAPHGPFGNGSEIWVEFNPELDRDYTYQFWVLEPPKGTEVVNINWRDNPWFPDFLREQKNDMRKRDYEGYLTTWEGQVRRVLKGAIYAKELELAASEQRISPHILVDKMRPVDISADLGRSDMTSLWFSQQVGMEHRFVDYYGNFGFDWSHYIKVIQDRGYIVGRIFLPHDASAKQLAAAKSIERQTRDAYPGPNKVYVVPRTTSVANDINAVRAMFPRMFFNEKFCSDGITGLAHYQYDVDPDTKEVSDKPNHDWASHPADALRCYVMGLQSDTSRSRGPQMHMPGAPTGTRGQDRLGWMS
jgi:phage terminase large subunit